MSEGNYKAVKLGPKEVEIPEEWDCQQLKLLLKKNESGKWGKESKGKGYPVLRSNNISLTGNLIEEDIKFRELSDFEKYRAIEGDILIVSSSGSEKHIGKKLYIDNQIESKNFAFTNFLQRLRLNRGINEKFIFYYLISYHEKCYVQSITPTSTGLRNLDMDDYTKLKVPLPPLPEQEHIASILSTVDEVIQQTDEVIEKSKELKKGLMQDLLTKGIGHDKFKKVKLGPKEVEIPEEWEIERLKYISKKGEKTFIDGDWVESKNMVDNGQIQLIQLGNIGVGRFKGNCNKFISEKFFDENNCTLVEPGDLLISRMAEPILRTLIVPKFEKKSITAVDVVVAKVDETRWDKRYIMSILNYGIWRSIGEAWASGTTRLRISRKNIEKIKIPYPPLPEQEQIASILSTVDEKIQKEKIYKEKLQELKQGLMQDLLTGKVRVTGLIRS